MIRKYSFPCYCTHYFERVGILHLENESIARTHTDFAIMNPEYLAPVYLMRPTDFFA